MPRHASYVSYADGLGVLAFAALLLMLRSRRINLGEVCGEMALTVTGYLRRPPDRVAEKRLAGVFAEFDRELAVILADRPRAAVPGR